MPDRVCGRNDLPWILVHGNAEEGCEKPAILVSSITFGIGHIVNLFAGQAALETVIQVFFAIAWGFLFTMVFWKTDSMRPGILAHALVDAFSKFGNLDYAFEMVCMAVRIALSAVYCMCLQRSGKTESVFIKKKT